MCKIPVPGGQKKNFRKANKKKVSFHYTKKFPKKGKKKSLKKLVRLCNFIGLKSEQQVKGRKNHPSIRKKFPKRTKN
jgi:hypothetical protein